MNKYLRMCVYAAAVAVLQPYGVRPAAAQAAAPIRQPKAFLTVDVPIQELIDGYHAWIASHPTARVKPIPIPGTTEVADRRHYIIKSFSIDFYGKDGVSLHHGIDASENAAFIRGLPYNMPSSPPTDETRPTLSESLAMFPELKPYLIAYATSHQYVLFSTQNLTKLSGSPQNDALKEVNSRAGKRKFLVIDLRFHD